MLILPPQQLAIVRRYKQRYACHSLLHALSCILLEADGDMADEERCELQYAREAQAQLPAGAGVPVYQRSRDFELRLDRW
jgi:hypothetical protein